MGGFELWDISIMRGGMAWRWCVWTSWLFSYDRQGLISVDEAVEMKWGSGFAIMDGVSLGVVRGDNDMYILPRWW